MCGHGFCAHTIVSLPHDSSIISRRCGREAGSGQSHEESLANGEIDLGILHHLKCVDGWRDVRSVRNFLCENSEFIA